MLTLNQSTHTYNAHAEVDENIHEEKAVQQGVKVQSVSWYCVVQ
jgi:hypothetical protein